MRRQAFLGKWEGFQSIRKVALGEEREEHLRLKEVLKRQRGIVIRLLTGFVVGRKRQALWWVLERVRGWGDARE